MEGSHFDEKILRRTNRKLPNNERNSSVPPTQFHGIAHALPNAHAKTYFPKIGLKLLKGYQILIPCCLLASFSLASPITSVGKMTKSVGDNDESPDQISQSLNLTLDSTEEVGLMSSETTSGEFKSLPVGNSVKNGRSITGNFRRSTSSIKTKAKSKRSKRPR